jgi:hypothetical protein
VNTFSRMCGTINPGSCIRWILSFDIKTGHDRYLWGLIHMVSGIRTSRNKNHMFGSWLIGKGTKVKRFLLAGASALVWAIWLSRNEVVFDKAPQKSFMQVLSGQHIGSGYGVNWRSMTRTRRIKTACQSLEMAALQIFNDHGWSTSKRICGS